MSKQEAPLTALNDFLPPGSFELVRKYLLEHKVHLTITRARISVLGDYRNAIDGKNHRITVNGNLNPYAFLITLLHELAHLLNFISFGNRIQPHGKEWKNCFARLLVDFNQVGIFPPDIYRALSQSFRDPAASSCADDNLIRVLRNYDPGAKRSLLLGTTGQREFIHYSWREDFPERREDPKEISMRGIKNRAALFIQSCL